MAAPLAALGSFLEPVPSTMTFSAALTATTIRGALRARLGRGALIGIVSAEAVALMEGVLATMTIGKLLLVATAVLVAGSVATGAALNGQRDVEERPGRAAPHQPTTPQSPQVDLYGDPLPAGVASQSGTVRFRNDERIEGIAFSRDGRFLVTKQGAQGLQVWDGQQGRKLHRIDLGLEVIYDIAVAPDGKRVVVAGFVFDHDERLVVHRLTVLDLATGGEVIRCEGGEEHAIWRLACAADSRRIATIASHFGM
jgi:hypothetical protein